MYDMSGSNVPNSIDGIVFYYKSTLIELFDVFETVQKLYIY